MRILNNTAIAETNGEERAFGPLPVIEMEMVNVDELGWKVDDPGYDTVYTTSDVPYCVPALFKDFFTLIHNERYNRDQINYNAEITLPFDIPSGYYYIKNVNDNNLNLFCNAMIVEHWGGEQGGTFVSITLADTFGYHVWYHFDGTQNSDGSITLVNSD